MLARGLKRILLCLLGIAGLWLAGLSWFAWLVPAAPAEIEPADAIVALTGGKGRLEMGFKLLADGKGEALFISGVREASREELLRKAPAEMQPILQALPAKAITFGREAENTIGNAEETARWIREHEFKRVLLVTSNYHIPRALREFRELMPEVTFVPAPVFPDDFSAGGWWQDKHSRELMLSEYNKMLAGIARHWFLLLAPAP